MKKLSVLAGVLLLANASQVYGAVKNKLITDIQLVSPPNRLTYDVGEDVDLYGIAVKVTFEDGDEVVADYKDLICVGYDPQQLGSQLVLAQYGTESVPFAVTVHEGTVKEIKASLKGRDIWIGGTKLKPDDFTVLAVTDNGRTETITDFDYEPKFLNNGRNVITVTHGAFKSLVSVEARENICQSIRVETPGPQEFDVGEAFRWTGLKVIAHYLDGSEEDVTTACRVSGVNTGKAGKYHAEIDYQDKKTTYQVTVSSYTFNHLDISKYYDEGTVDLYFNERSTPITIEKENISYEDNQETGVRTFYVTYKNVTYDEDTSIPEDEQKAVGSNRIKIQVPVKLTAKVNSEGVLNSIQKTYVKNSGTSRVTIESSLVQDVSVVEGLPVIQEVKKDGSERIMLEFSPEVFRPDDGIMSFVFRTKLEV